MKHLSPPQRLSLGITISARWIPSCLSRFLFLSPQPPYNTKRPLRRREVKHSGADSENLERGGRPGTLARYIDTFYFAENSTKNNRKFQTKRGGRGTLGPPLNPPLALNCLLHSRSFVVKQRSSLSRPLRDHTKNGCGADFDYGSIII